MIVSIYSECWASDGAILLDASRHWPQEYPIRKAFSRASVIEHVYFALRQLSKYILRYGK